MFGLLTIGLMGLQAATQPTTAAPSGTIVVEGKKEPKVCRTIDAHTGSRIGVQRICRPAAEWKMSEDQAQRILEKDQERTRAVQAYDQNAKNGLAAQGPK